MKLFPLLTSTAASILAFTCANAQEKNMSVTELLKHTPEKLAQILGNTSEAGEDHAAQLWATAKRTQTNAKLAKTSVQALQRLNEWRDVLNKWEDLKLQAQGIESGGGTMWSHLSARNDAYIETFLAKHLTTLSAMRKHSGKPFEPDYLKLLNAIIDSGVKEFGADNEAIRNHATSVKNNLQNTYYSIQYLMSTLPDGETKKQVINLIKPRSR